MRHPRSHAPLFALPIAALLGCLGDGALDRHGDTLEMSSAEVALVLDLVNYPGTSFEVLDKDARLDRRAAQNIVTYRNGPDGVTPTKDDLLFHTIEQLDRIPYVGPSALGKLLDFAAANPPPAAELVDGVFFRGWEVEAVVLGVNQATVEELRGLGLTTRAAENLVEAAPVASVSEIGDVPYVGPASLGRLRTNAGAWWKRLLGGGGGAGGTFAGVTFSDELAEIAIEIANRATFELLTGQGGMWTAGANRLIGARPYQDLAEVAGTQGIGTSTMQTLHDYADSGLWIDPELDCMNDPAGPCGGVVGGRTGGDLCDRDQPCGPGLVCAGLSQFEFGHCRENWKHGVFQSSAPLEIPSSTGAEIVETIQVTGLASVPEDIWITLALDHTDPDAIRITLVTPGGDRAVVWDGPTASRPFPTYERLVGCCIPRDDMVNGTWRLEVRNVRGRGTGQLTGHTLRLTSRWD
jgi:DNA uptake protein ComE-like DNA-binding protein/subtilisin-like proprotein convertase family protein